VSEGKSGEGGGSHYSMTHTACREWRQLVQNSHVWNGSAGWCRSTPMGLKCWIGEWRGKWSHVGKQRPKHTQVSVTCSCREFSFSPDGFIVGGGFPVLPEVVLERTPRGTTAAETELYWRAGRYLGFATWRHERAQRLFEMNCAVVHEYNSAARKRALHLFRYDHKNNVSKAK